jgi:hypothetical protein
MARGSPSSRAQIAATAAAFVVVRAKSGRAAWARRLGAPREEGDRRVRRERRHVGQVCRSGEGERRDGDDPLGGEVERRAARR